MLHSGVRLPDRRVPIPLKDFSTRFCFGSPFPYPRLPLSLSICLLSRGRAKSICSVHRAIPCEWRNPFNPAVTSRINEQRGLLSFLGYYLREWLPPSVSERPTSFLLHPASVPSALRFRPEEKINPFVPRERFLYGSYSEGIFMSVHGRPGARVYTDARIGSLCGIRNAAKCALGPVACYILRIVSFLSVRRFEGRASFYVSRSGGFGDRFVDSNDDNNNNNNNGNKFTLLSCTRLIEL